MKLFSICLSLSVLVLSNLEAKDIRTNAAVLLNAPKWLKQIRVESVTARIQNYLEWSTRRITVHWYTDQKSFEKSHKLGPMALALAKGDGKSIHLGPKVKSNNFDAVFGHEMVHIIFRQKYKGAIPRWLEEGLANYVGRNGKVDYPWIAKMKFPADVRELTHPFKKISPNAIHYHYQASQALVEMIAKKCDLTNLLRLSVERKMENYLTTYCEIKDLNSSFKKWVTKKSLINLKKNAS